MMAALALATVEMLTFEPRSHRGARMFDALTASATPSITVRSTTTYRGGSDVLMVWGPGSPLRFGPMRQQLAAGGHVVAFDLAYWNREQKIRCSIDGAHPQKWVMTRDWPMTRLEGDRPPMTDCWNPEGPVIVAGIGVKSKVQYGAAVVYDWEARMIAACRADGRAVLYRRKYGMGDVPVGAVLASDGPIETVLSGASLVITWHSNVAVDAIRLGIPVVCQDGAAAAVCSNTIPRVLTPLDAAVRTRFLANLAWFQWAPSEAAVCWRFLQELLA